MGSKIPSRLTFLFLGAALLLSASAAQADGGPFDFFTLPTVAAPCRLFDSRFDAPGPLTGGVATSIPIAGPLAACGLPVSAKAVAFNVTVVDPTANGHVVVYGDTEPGTSTVNFRAGQTRANNAVLELAVDGSIHVKPYLAGTVHVILDVSGYFDDGTPAVISTTPANSATGVAVNSNITINFNKPVNVTGNWFQIVCGTSGTRNVADTAVSGGPLSFTINPNTDFTAGESCTVTVFAAQVSDQDANDPPDNPSTNYSFSFSTDEVPSVVSTVPANGATSSTATNLTITFSEAVNVTGNWFQIVCSTSGTRNVVDTVVTGGPTTFTINPNADFAEGESCAVTVFAAQVADQDTNDPPDTMAGNYGFSFTTDTAPSVTASVPTNGGAVLAGGDLTITFSEPVNVTGNWFQIVCTTSGTRNIADTVVTGGPTTFTINPNTDFAAGESCTATVFAAQVADQDANDPPDQMAANYVFSFTSDAAPSVSSTVPATGATGVALNSDLTITFSEAVNVTGNWFQIVCPTSGTRNVADTVVTGGPTTFTINPNTDFAAGETCTVTVFAAQVADQDSNDPPDTMTADYVFSYTADEAPSVSATTPVNGATGVGGGTDLTVTFSEPVNVTGNWFQIVCGVSGTRNVADTVVTGGPTTFTINPNADFAAGETCTVTVFAAQVADQDANDPPDTMAANYVFSYTIDQAPSVTSTVPANGATSSTTTDLTINFSEPVNVTGNWFQIVCATSGTRNVADTVVTGGPMAFTVNPNTDLAEGESCTVTVFGAQVSDQDLADPPDTMVANYVFSFTTDTAPTVSSTVPVNGGFVAASSDLTVTFSEPVNVTGNWFQIVCTTSGTRNVADTVVTGGPTTFTINPNSDFVAGESCTATIFAAQVADQDSNDPPDTMAANYVFTFGSDAAPSVSSTTPANGATGQATNTNLSITFSEPVNVTGNWFQIVCATSGARNVADTVVTGGPITFTINPNSDFAAGESCTVTVFAAQVADQDANDPPDTMAANYVFTYSMDVAPSVSSTTPANGATGQAASTNLTIDFSEPVTVTGNWFQIVCGVSGTRNVADTVVSGGPTSFTVNPNADFAAGETCTVTVFAAQVSDQDANDPPDTMAANYVFSYTIDQAPSVSSTVPANASTTATTNTDLTINFSEPVNVTGNWFQIVCGTSGTRNVADTVVTGGPMSFTINPNVDFAGGESCTVTVFAAQVSDQDLADPPDTMLANYVFTFSTDAPPSVTTTVPANSAITSPSTNLTITFSEPVTVTGNWFQIVCSVTGTRNVADTVVTGGPTTFTINPNVDFAANESCTTTVFAAQVADQDANDPPDTMAADYVFSYSVDAPPSVLSTVPADTATGQATNTNLTITFSEPVNVTGNWFQIVCTTSGTRNVVDTVVTGGPTTFTINPNVDFVASESCTVTVFAAQVTDQDANDPPDTMAANYVFTYSMDAAPSVTATTPTTGATNQASNTNLTVTFSEPVNVTGNWFQIVCGTSGTRNVADTVVTGGPTTFTINSNVDFAAGESCTVTVFAAQVSDQDGNDPPDNLTANYVWSYSIDAAPSVTATVPTNGATNQASNTSLSVTFSEPVNVTGNWFQIVCGTSGTRNVSDTVVTGGPTTFAIDPNVDFAPGETCTVTVFAVQVTDQDSNDPPDTMAANYVFSFTMDAAPSVLSTVPANGAINVPGASTITINFSESVSASVSSFLLECPTGSGARTFTLSASPASSFTLTPSALLPGNQTCTVTVFAASISDTDVADPPDTMQSNYSFSFTIINTPPQLIGSPKETFDTIGNTSFEFKSAQTLSPGIFVSGRLKDNFTDTDGPSPLFIERVVGCADLTSPYICATTNGGSVTVDSNGEFSFTPKAGDAAASDTFTYRISDGLDTVDRLVTINLKNRVWYVKNNAPAGGLGRSGDPFDTLAEADAASSANDYIFVYFGNGSSTGQTAGITLKSGQHLIGEHTGLTVQITTGSFNGTAAPTSVSLVPAAAGNRPLIDNAGGNAVAATNAIPTEITGVSLSGNLNAIDLTTTAAFAASTMSITNNVIRAAGAEGMDINLNAGTTGTLTLNVTGNSWSAASASNGFDARTAAAGAVLRLNFSTNTGILSNATGVLIDGSGGGTITITGFDSNTVHQNTVGTGISITSATFDATPGGSFDTVNAGNTAVGVPGDGVGGSGIVMATVSGAINFTGLDVYASGGAGLQVTGTGTFNASSGMSVSAGLNVGTIEATGGPAVSLSSTSANLQLSSLKSTNSTSTGVSLVNVADYISPSSPSIFTAGVGSSITNATGTDFNIDGGNATISYPGTITDTTGRLVSVINTTGDTKTFTGTISDTGSGTGQGIFLNSNTGATISFSGALTLSTGSSDAFTATGGGTVTATSTSNTLTTTTGTALNVANTTIGALGLKFRSISAGTAASGPANGIILNTTGSSGSLTVLGTGSAGSGGTIQSTTSHGVSLTSTLSPSFDRMIIKNTGGSGIKGTTVTNFTFTNGSIDNSGTALGADESNIAFNNTAAGTENNLSGTATITGNTLTNAYYHGVDIFNSNGTLSSVNISNNTITSATSTANSKGSGIRLIAFGSASTVASVTAATIMNNVITNFPSGAGIVAQGGNANTSGAAGTFGIANDVSNVVTITGNRIAGQSSANKMGTNAIVAVVNGKGQGNFNISNNGTVANPITNIAGNVISHSSLGIANVTSTISNNVIVANQTPDFGGPLGISVGIDQVTGIGSSSSLETTITGNSVSNTDGSGIRVTATQNSTGTLRAKIQNNTVAAPLGTGASNGIFVASGTTSGTGNPTVCLNISGNTSAGETGVQGIGLRKQGTVSTTFTFGLHNLSSGVGACSGTAVPAGTPNVENFVNCLNPAGSGTLLVSATSGFTSCSFP